MTAGTLYRRALADNWVVYTLGVLTLLVTSTTEVLIPRFIQWTFDTVSGQRPAPLGRLAALHDLTLLLLLTLLVGWVGRFGWRQLLARRTHVAGRDLKVRFWSVLRYQPLRTFHDYTLGDLMNRATGDWTASRAIHGFTIVLTLDLIFFTTLSLVSMLTIDVELTLYCLAVFPLLPRIILKLARREHDLHIHAQEKLGHLSDHIAQALGTIRLQRATASDAPWQDRLAAEAREYANRRFQVVKTGWKIFPLGAVPTLIAYGVLLYWGVRKIESGEITVGAFVALQSYVLMLQGPLFDMGDCIAEWQKGFASLGRIAEIFSLQKVADRLRAKSVVPVPRSGTPAVEVRDLTFGYAESQGRSVLRGVSLVIHPRETVGIYGPIGSGKTTLLSLMSGLLEGPAGRVLVAGADSTEIRRDWLAQHVTMVPQRSFLFAGSIRYNLVLDEAFTDEQLWEALALVRMDSDVKGFVGGLDTWIGEWGINLSGGQKQRLALARALLRPRELILLDDCLSAVDSVTEEEILRRLRGRIGHATVVWVAHRMSTLKLCDRIFTLDEGVLALVRERAAQ